MQFHFAPLQGYTDYDYRNAHATVYGPADTYYTPFVRLEKGREFRPKDLKDIAPTTIMCPTSCHSSSLGRTTRQPPSST